MILVVDDDPELTSLLSDVFEEEHIETCRVNNGALALETIDKHPVDLICSDYKMPQMTGIDLLSQVRQRGMNTPFVMITGYPDVQMILRALRLGATDVLMKPFDVDEVKDIVFRALEIGRAFRDTERRITAAAEKKQMPSSLAEDLQRDMKKIARLRSANDHLRQSV